MAPPAAGGALLAVGLDDVDGDVAELGLVLASVVPAEDEVATAGEHDTHLGQRAAPVAVEGNDQVVGGGGRRQRLGHLGHHSLSTARTRGCGSASCTAPGWTPVFPLLRSLRWTRPGLVSR